MNPEDVPDEWAEAAAIARHEYRRRLSPLAISLGWYDLDPEDHDWMLSEARHALAAVAPLIAAAEREAAAMKLDAIADVHRSAAHALLDAKNMVGAEIRETQALAFNNAAAAIRARGDKP